MSAFSVGSGIDGSVGTLGVVFGDQLNRDSRLFQNLKKDCDTILMMEVAAESEEGPSHRARTAFFLAAMRHFAQGLTDDGWRVRYITLDDRHNTQSFAGEIERAVKLLRPDRMLCVRPGDWRVYQEAESWADKFAVDAEILEDDHFITTPAEFSEWAEGRKSLTMEYFYREQRKKHGILMDDGDPEGGDWNYDKENRETFKDSPDAPPLDMPEPDEITQEVIDLVNERLADNPGRLSADSFFWPVTRSDALASLEDFVEHRLKLFGPYEDAMWTGENALYHSLLSPMLNVKLLDPMECVEAALEAYKKGSAPINSVEGFVRQLIGWREFMRGVYWHEGPDYRDRNWMQDDGELPSFYWDGDTDMKCVRECLTPVLDHAWSHHIPRLMILANLGLISGVNPRAVGDWFYGMYADSVDWVTTPNTIGMGMYADGERDSNGKSIRLPVVGTKPYSASGKYISRMSNYCKHCPYDVKKRTGDDACPFNTFYWDFLIRHRETFRGNNRMAMLLKNVDRLDDDEKEAIRRRAGGLRSSWGI